MLVQIILFEGFDPLDVVAPFEVLSAGSDALGGSLELRLVVTDEPRSVVSGTRGLELTATHVLEPEAPGIVILPGASGPTSGDPDLVKTIPVILAGLAETELPDLMRRAFAAPDVLVATICGGGLALGMAGLLEGRTAVTHTLGNDVLEATGTTVVRARVVDDGDFISAGGVTSGLDLALYLLEREFGPQIAHAVEQLFEYERRGTVWAARGPEAKQL
ncbi:glutamine amidotransferase [Pseudoclavibacter sp. RFBJ3]|uniref:DJ-1/PfpI family protein n=1 Tax=unclassified Pseudoclavibacter TaxID=2615177 RepID=UPI000CE7E968|nr:MULTISPECIES: DJ-1/PfpI family protein [unclassified Pseudoclavibacter]PPF87505.1 glutamine amidotransferase [Pseudoclavibacter sp. RFBJ5]PPF90355.1 glutamine amidotransferase [Pseudoclavibacter sp. RFBJ3]PPG01040.1 glutamine amidotransferase [Pseudoclavibacter sp. RFBH5]PPG26143.1 glutamine amidotransferase [Pseudoclavibacter sp. RFBI4]